MKLLIIDDDNRQMSHVCGLLRRMGHSVVQVKEWYKVKENIEEFSPEGIILDLMIPAVGLPIEEAEKCNGGYTTGVYIYHQIIHNIASGIPFVVYTGLPLDVRNIDKEVSSLTKYKEFKGVIGKGDDIEELIINKLKKERK
jgi:DNA-binding NtrC family response regulator